MQVTWFQFLWVLLQTHLSGHYYGMGKKAGWQIRITITTTAIATIKNNNINKYVCDAPMGACTWALPLPNGLTVEKDLRTVSMLSNLGFVWVSGPWDQPFPVGWVSSALLRSLLAKPCPCSSSRNPHLASLRLPGKFLEC